MSTSTPNRPGRWPDAFGWYWRIGLVLCIGLALGWVPYGGDAPIWWASRPPDPYAYAVYASDIPGFFYAPAFAQVLAPVTSIVSESVFVALWLALSWAALWVLAGRWALVCLLLAPVTIDLYTGNIHLLLGVVASVGLRHPTLWAFALLTKVTPGVGLLWFALRREWRHLAMALGVTAAVMAGSAVLAPELWPRWIELLTSNGGAEVAYPHIAVPLVVRLPIAVALIAWGALTGRAWVVPVGSMLALPGFWFNGLAMLTATIRLTARRA